MSFPVDDGSNTTGVATSGDHAQIAGLKLDRVHDLVCVNVQSDNIVHLRETGSRQYLITTRLQPNLILKFTDFLFNREEFLVNFF